MNQDTQLLATFVNKKDIDTTIEAIKKTYKLAFNKIYVLDIVDDETQVILTYNIELGDTYREDPLPSTISVHRKKQTNTIYTINAINKLIEEKNGGKLDKSFIIDWLELKNTVLVTAYGSLKKVNTKISHIITL